MSYRPLTRLGTADYNLLSSARTELFCLCPCPTQDSQHCTEATTGVSSPKGTRHRDGGLPTGTHWRAGVSDTTCCDSRNRLHLVSLRPCLASLPSDFRCPLLQVSTALAVPALFRFSVRDFLSVPSRLDLWQQVVWHFEIAPTQLLHPWAELHRAAWPAQQNSPSPPAAFL